MLITQSIFFFFLRKKKKLKYWIFFFFFFFFWIAKFGNIFGACDLSSGEIMSIRQLKVVGDSQNFLKLQEKVDIIWFENLIYFN